MSESENQPVTRREFNELAIVMFVMIILAFIATGEVQLWQRVVLLLVAVGLMALWLLRSKMRRT
ncbi:hypothetical protein ACERK3_02155 [Phycisphaerales bacterium AB-hyl4]|uniref:Uncharacterized protein n=1 Tax=Natronomicrosphaera hydrolytica TaxID=3242702 RepID=A0ABV4U0F4_9BACT